MGIESGRPGPAGPVTGATVHYTMVFNSFVMMTLCNEVNSRKLHDEKNVFVNILHNQIFVGVLVTTLVLQVLIVHFGGIFVVVAQLSVLQFVICIIIGLTTFPVRYVITFIPDRFFPDFGTKKQKLKQKNLARVQEMTTIGKQT